MDSYSSRNRKTGIAIGGAAIQQDYNNDIRSTKILGETGTATAETAIAETAAATAGRAIAEGATASHCYNTNSQRKNSRTLIAQAGEKTRTYWKHNSK